MKNFNLTLMFIIMFSTLANAKDNIIGDLSQKNVSINATFEGSSILIFGAIKRDNSIRAEASDIIIEVIGPNQSATLRKKRKILGIWVNSETIPIEAVPSFYAAYYTQPIQEILGSSEINKLGIGLEKSIRTRVKNENIEINEAITRIKNNNGSYLKETPPINFNQETLFSAKVELPANLTEGNYKTRIHLVQNQKIIDSSESKIRVQKIGLEKWLHSTAHSNPLLYGIFSIFLALFSGWAASEIFRIFRR